MHVRQQICLVGGIYHLLNLYLQLDFEQRLSRNGTHESSDLEDQGFSPPQESAREKNV